MGRRASCASPRRRPSLRPWRGWLGSHSSAGTWDKLGGGGYEINSLFRPSQTSCMGTSSGWASDEKAGGEAGDRVTAGKWSSTELGIASVRLGCAEGWNGCFLTESVCGWGGGYYEDLEDNQSAFPRRGCWEEKKDGISIPIKKRVTSLPRLSLEKYHPCKCVCVCNVVCAAITGLANERTERIDCWNVKCFALCMFFSFLQYSLSLCVCGIKKKKRNVVTATCHQAVNSPRSINRMLSATSCPSRALFPCSHSEDAAGLSMTLAAPQRLLADDRECLALLDVWLMASVSLSGSLSMGRIAEGHCVCTLPSSALLLYRNALIDILEVLINKRTHSFLTLTVFALLVSFFGL